MIAWLPKIITLEEFDGDYEKDLNHLHEIFLNNFAQTKLKIDNKPIYYDDRVIDSSGKCECFIHITTCADDVTKDRNFDPRRCERLVWVKPTIENRTDEVSVKIWEVRKKGKNKLNILIESERYHVVLTKYKKSYVLNTAYYVDQNHYAAKAFKGVPERIKTE